MALPQRLYWRIYFNTRIVSESAATLYCESKLALLKLNLLESKGQPVDMDELKTLLQRNASLLAEMPYSQDYSIVHSAHHLASMTFRKAVGPPEAFYKEAVLYLNYTAMADIDNAYQLAVDLSLAALTGDGVFNFGQVVTTPNLDGTTRIHLTNG